jgi:hypothetical protein
MTEPGWLTGLHDPEALPTLDETNRAYFAAAARGEFILQRCSAGHAILYPRLVCPVCHDDQLEWSRLREPGRLSAMRRSIALCGAPSGGPGCVWSCWFGSMRVRR